MCLTVHACPLFPPQKFVTLSLFFSTKSGRGMWLNVHAWPPFPPQNLGALSLFFSTKYRRGICFTVHAWPLFPYKMSWHYPFFSVQNRHEGCVWREASPSLDWQDPLPSQHLQLWQLQVSSYQHLAEKRILKCINFFPRWRKVVIRSLWGLLARVIKKFAAQRCVIGV